MFALLGVGLAQPASAAPGATIDDITRIGCVISVTVTSEDAGTYWLTAWDDGNQRFAEAHEFEANETQVLTFTVLWPILQGAAGLGIYIESAETDGETYAAVGSYAGADDVGQACADSGGEDSGEPPGALLEAVADGCSIEATITSTGLGDYTLVALDGTDVLAETDFVGTAGQVQTLTTTLEPPAGPTIEVQVLDAETQDVYATQEVTVDCELAPTTTVTAPPTTAAPTTTTPTPTTTPPAVRAVVANPRFTG